MLFTIQLLSLSELLVVIFFVILGGFSSSLGLLEFTGEPFNDELVSEVDLSSLGSLDGSNNVVLELVNLFLSHFGSETFDDGDGLVFLDGLGDGGEVLLDAGLGGAVDAVNQEGELTATLLPELLPEGEGAFGVSGVDAGLLNDAVEDAPLGLSFLVEGFSGEDGLEGLDDVGADDGPVGVLGAVQDVAHAELLERFDGLGHVDEERQCGGDELGEVHLLLGDLGVLEVLFLEEGEVGEESAIEDGTEGLGFVGGTEFKGESP